MHHRLYNNPSLHTKKPRPTSCTSLSLPETILTACVRACMRFLASCSRFQAVACLGDTTGFGSGCTLLQSLSVADCKRVSDASLSALAKGCRRLRFLNLSGCDKVYIRTSSSVFFTVALWGCFNDLPCLLRAKGM